MVEEQKTIEQQAKEADLERIEKIKISIAKIEKKESKFLFFVPTSPQPNASVYEIYFHATTVKNLGYNVKILTDSSDYKIPDWIEKELTDLPHESMERSKLTIGPEDVVVIPEIFSNVMEQTKNLPSIRVGLLQSIDYMINGLMPGTEWKTFGIQKIITTSQNLKDIIQTYYGKTYDVKTYNIGIPSYFFRTKELKRPVISIVGRNPNEISKIVKLFYAKYPQYSWITFDTMLTNSKPPTHMRRIDYAERLKKNFAGVWIDRIASFGTFPLECMAAGTIPIGLVPDVTPSYMIDENDEPKENIGVWTRDIYAIPLLIGDVITKFLDDTIGDEIENTMKQVASDFNQDKSKEELEKIYQDLLNERLGVLKNAVTEFETRNKITEQITESKPE